jgi:hypothetical protein
MGVLDRTTEIDQSTIRSNSMQTGSALIFSLFGTGLTLCACRAMDVGHCSIAKRAVRLRTDQNKNNDALK